MISDYSKENQISTNKLIITVLNIKAFAGLIMLVLECTLNSNTVFQSIFKTCFLPLYLLTIIIIIIVRHIGLAKTASKYILFAALIFSLFVSFFIFGIYSSLFLIIPVIVSARALNRKETFLIGLCTWFSSVIALILNVQLNRVSKTIRAFHEYQSILIWDYPQEVFSYYFVPITFSFIFILLVSDNIISNGKKQIENEIKLSSELTAASLIQQNTLPSRSFNSHDGLISINAEQKPAKDMSGDFFDYIAIDDNHVVFLVADVTDKGVPAALFMMAAQKALHISLQENKDLSKAIYSANNMLCQNNPTNMFLTLWIGITDTTNNTIDYINCGHPMPILIDRKNKVSFVENEPNLFVGCFENAEFPVSRIPFNKGDKLIIYTDGVTDIRDKQDQSFGTDRLLDTIRKGTHTPKDIISNCLNFSAHTAQFDDMTIMEISHN